jgi:hypothetical protein
VCPFISEVIYNPSKQTIFPNGYSCKHRKNKQPPEDGQELRPKYVGAEIDK